MSELILARHGESQLEAKGLWTGNWDVPLTERGRKQAVSIARAIKDHHPTIAYTSTLSRAKDTLAIIVETNHWKIPVKADPILDERNYGDLTGMNKWVVEEKNGTEQISHWRRDWDEPVPDGETLKQVFKRVFPFYENEIEPHLKKDESVLILSHGNPLRTLIKGLEELSDPEFEATEVPFGEIFVYSLDKTAKITNKEVLKLDIKPKAA